MTFPFQGVVFDVDGTLLESMSIWKQVDHIFLEKRNIKVPSSLDHNICGLSFTETAAHFQNVFQLPQSVEEIKDEFRDIASSLYSDVGLKPGVLQFIQLLRDLNVPLGIATSTDRKILDKTLLKLDIAHYFSATKTSCEVPKGKPSPDVFLAAARDLNVDPSLCLAFEDSVQGAVSAREAGMKVFAIRDNHAIKNENELKVISDGHYFNDWHEVLIHFEEFFN
ncbi:hypothetical protein GEMRC1_003238 [Eukaryota sp. GEM-RC1]